ncbi:adenylate/guanylate cyclase domain-containing protein [Saccharicrinis fermentans]|uniref:Adenylate cyclase 2 n=1 Tax=Saccharicrinis fermentans DSM 9555 = JCM 21142 TaxID=869213 RepID=W7Y8C6_9BACT|nr:adenylate/guanylate cyclase domain-containing protein [Saccharicrinis fermentans]GAF03943.1 adenylate cyclase 2 [Saccharicrinis fermentans DSM 9555 = JCM 21142]
MFLKEKLKIWFSQIFKSFRYHLIYWNLALFFFLFLTDDQSVFINYFGLLTKESLYANVVFASVIITALFSFLDMFFSDRIMRFSPVRTLGFLRSLLYLALAFGLLYLAENKKLDLRTVLDYSVFIEHMPDFELRHIRFLVYFYFACIANSTFKEMYRKIGVGNFLNWFFGRLDKPREEKKIFMFIDMKASTAKAELLGHEKFSRLVQDVFNDMSVLYNYHGEIYNYLGDGAVVTWDENKGLRNNNCIRSFFAFLRVIERRSRYYRWRYGFVPEFKAGLHIGKVMVLQVGSIRRDISYNGDTINTAARIESQCNELKKNLLISGVLYEAFDEKDSFIFKQLDSLHLKGKRRPLPVYSVQLKKTKRRRKKKTV